MKKIQIYIGNDTTRDEAEMKEPNILFYKDVRGFVGEKRYKQDMDKYNARIDNIPRHKVIGPHSWKVGQRLEEGVDFKTAHPPKLSKDDPETVIIPIEGEQEETQEHTISVKAGDETNRMQIMAELMENIQDGWFETKKGKDILMRDWKIVSNQDFTVKLIITRKK